jgi:hypothetical protein
LSICLPLGLGNDNEEEIELASKVKIKIVKLSIHNKNIQRLLLCFYHTQQQDTYSRRDRYNYSSNRLIEE